MANFVGPTQQPPFLRYNALPPISGHPGGQATSNQTVGLTFPRGVRQTPSIVLSGSEGGEPAASFRNYVLGLSPHLFMRMSTLTTESTPRVKDESDWANHGSITGSPSIGGVAGLVTNEVDTATDFDGTDDRISVGLGTGLQLQQLTCFALIKPVSGQAMRLLAYESSDSASVARGFLLEVVLDSGNLRPVWTAGGNSVGAYNGINAANTISAAARHLIVGTFDGILQRIYIDGALSASKANGSGVISYANATGLNIGYRGFGGPFFSRGVHDEVGIIPFAMSDAQVLALYNKMLAVA